MAVLVTWLTSYIFMILFSSVNVAYIIPVPTTEFENLQYKLFPIQMHKEAELTFPKKGQRST